MIYAHYVADFICQSDGMAKGKSISNTWLTLHVVTYVAVMAIPVSMIFFFFGIHGIGLTYVSTVSWQMVLYWLILNGALHWITDYYTSRWSRSYFQIHDHHNGFAVIGFDQCIHYTCLLLTAKLVVG